MKRLFSFVLLSTIFISYVAAEEEIVPVDTTTVIPYDISTEWPQDPVFIIDAGGFGIPVDNWEPDMGCLAIGLNTEKVSARIAIDNISKRKVIWGPSGFVMGILTTQQNFSNMNPGVARQDFRGIDNTNKEVDLLYTQEESLMNLIGSYAFADGAIGYIPALGELEELFNYQEEINRALRKVGGTLLRNEWLWSSTQHYLDYRIWAYGGLNRDGSRCFAQLRNGDNTMGRQYGACLLNCRPFGELGEPGKHSDTKRVNVTVDMPSEADIKNFVIDFALPLKKQLESVDVQVPDGEITVEDGEEIK